MPGLPLKNPWTRPIPNPSQDLPNLFACVSALKETVESLIGQRGRSPNRAVTFNDLTAMGVLTQDAVASSDGSFAPPQGPPGPQGPTGPTGPTGATGPAGVYQAGAGIAINTGTTPPTISTAVPYLPLTGGTITGNFAIQNDQGGGYGGQWAMYNTSAGATNPAKYFRVSPVGTIEIINSAFSTVIFQFADNGAFALTGPIYMAGITFANQGANYHYLYDKSGRVAILLGGTADSQNYHQNTVHRFQGVGGATYDYYINSSGIIIQNGTAFRGRKVDGTVLALAYVGTDNNIRIGVEGSTNCFIGTGGSYFAADGNLYAGQAIILKNGVALYSTNAAGTNNYPVIYVASDNRIKINSSAAYNVDAYGTWTFASSLAAGDITSTGANAILIFADRAGSAPTSWGWYASNGIARLWNSSGDSIRFGVAASGAQIDILNGSATSVLTFSSAGPITTAPSIRSDGSNIVINAKAGGAGIYLGNDAPGPVMLAGNLYVNPGAISCGPLGDVTFGLIRSGTTRLLNFNTSCWLQYETANGNLVYTVNGQGCFTYRYSVDDLFFNNLAPMGGNGAYVNFSDRRMKELIEPTKKGLDVILALTPVEFVRLPPPEVKGEFEARSKQPPPRREIGFIAQDVVEVLPEAVSVAGIELRDGRGGLDDPEPTLGITSDTIVAVLVNAVKELTTRLLVLEEKLA